MRFFVTFVTLNENSYICPMMNGIFKSPIFRGLRSEETERLLEGRHRETRHKAGDVIALQGDRYLTLLIVDSGTVRGEMTNFAGERVIIEEIAAPRAIAPAIIYATENVLPVDVIAVTDVTIIAIRIDDFTQMLQSDTRVLQNFIRSISDRSKFLSDRVRLLRFGTIKSKMAAYLLEQIQKNGSTAFTIPQTHQELADMFGVTRPALSRAIGQLTDEGVIESKKNNYTVINRPKLLSLIK